LDKEGVFKIKTMISEVFNIDCMEGMKNYPDKFFDLAVVDPPYGININVSMGRRKGDKKSSYHKFAGNDSTIPDEIYFNELQRISTNQIIWGGNYMTDFLYPSSCWLMWDKGFSEDVTFAQFEMAWTSFKSSAKKFDKHPAQTNRIHPTQKPVKLYDWIYKNYLPEGGKVIDTHLGSGSNRIAADKAGNIDFTGFELDKDYYEGQEKRFKNYKQQLTLFK
jgi:site-specific DNA-methyltransferase (adenine-specific)